MPFTALLTHNHWHCIGNHFHDDVNWLEWTFKDSSFYENMNHYDYCCIEIGFN